LRATDECMNSNVKRIFEEHLKGIDAKLDTTKVLVDNLRFAFTLKTSESPIRETHKKQKYEDIIDKEESILEYFWVNHGYLTYDLYKEGGKNSPIEVLKRVIPEGRWFCSKGIVKREFTYEWNAIAFINIALNIKVNKVLYFDFREDSIQSIKNRQALISESLVVLGEEKEE